MSIKANTKTIFSPFLDIIRWLKEEGATGDEIKKIPQRKMLRGKQVYTTLSDLKFTKIDMEQFMAKHNLSPDYKIGLRMLQLRQVGNGKKEYKITPEEIKIAEAFGLLKRESEVAKGIKILWILYNEGVNINKIPQTQVIDKKQVSTTLKDIKQPGINIDEIILAYNLDAEFEIGEAIHRVLGAYHGKNTYPITEAEKYEVELLGLSQKASVISKALPICEGLYIKGVGLTDIPKTKKEGDKRVSTTLEDIEHDGIDIKRFASEHGIDTNYPIGEQIKILEQTLRGTITYAMTNEERAKAIAIGLGEEKKSAIDKFLWTMGILNIEGIDTSKIQQTKREGKKLISTAIADINQDGFDIEEVIARRRLNRNYKIGEGKTRYRKEYIAGRLTGEQERLGEKLGAVTIADMETKQKRLQEKLEKAEALKQEAEMQTGKAK